MHRAFGLAQATTRRARLWAVMRLPILILALGLAWGAPALAAVGTNPASGNPNDYGGGNWLGTAGNDQYTNNNGATVTGSVDMRQGGSDTVTNRGTVTQSIYMSSIGNNTVENSGTVATIYGSYNGNPGESGGGNTVTITNSGTVTSSVIGSFNNVANAGGGGNTITNNGAVNAHLYGNVNQGNNASGGGNSITNSGTVNGSLVGSLNNGNGSSGGGNTIINNGTVNQTLYGTQNFGAGSSGGGNTITNNGTVLLSIVGNDGSSGGQGNTITNNGTVGGSILAGDGNDTVTVGAASNVNGVVNGQGGDDKLYFGVAGTFTQAGLAPTYLNFEHLGLSISGNTTLTGAWTLDLSATVNNGGQMTLAGGGSLSAPSLTVNSGGTADINGTATVTGATTVGGALNVNTGGSLTTGSLGINSGGTANINGTATATGGTKVDGSLSVASGGTLTTGSLGIGQGGSVDVSGTLSTGSTDCSGQLHVNGALNSPTVVIRPSGFLWGSGVINGNLGIHGTVAPGNSIGTLRVNGDLTFMPGSVYQAELSSGGESDLIAVDGRATLSGGRVSTDLPRALYVDRFAWSLISATDGVSGAFEGVDGQPNSQTLSLHAVSYGDKVKLEVWRKAFSSFGGGSGAAEVGEGLDRIVPLAVGRKGDLANLIYDMDWGYGAAQISNTLRRLSPEMYASYAPAGLHGADIFDRALERRADEVLLGRRAGLTPSPSGEGLLLAAADDAAPLARPEAAALQSQGWNSWGTGLGSWSNHSGSEGHLGQRQRLGGVAGGVDGWLNDWLLLGLGVAASRSSLDWGQSHLSGELQGLHTGVYAAAQAACGLHGQASLSYSRYLAAGTRDLDLSPGNHRQAQGSFQSWTGLARLNGGYDFRLGGWLAGPTAGLRLAHWRQDAFDESGAGSLGLKIADADHQSLNSSLGLRASTKLTWGGWQLMPRLSLEWRHEYKTASPELTASFPNYEDSAFTTTGLAPVADLVVAQAGLATRIQGRLSAFMDYSLAQGQDYSANTVGVGLQYQF
ncbi:MAG: autotransporter domain-containing protein [Desulfarculus sp.]|nr:autotransporter domain-containing protein [Desulfarculus sp.]